MADTSPKKKVAAKPKKPTLTRTSSKTPTKIFTNFE
jgi:hypothetical protein